MSKKIMRALAVLIFVIPIIYMIMWAFIERWSFEQVLPEIYTTRAWKNIFTNKHILQTILKSITMSMGVAFISVAFTYTAAKAIALYDFKYKNVFRLILFIPLLIPVMSLSIGLHLNFLRLGLANTYFGVMLVHVFLSIPYCFIIMEPVIRSVGINYENQARLLGANSFQTHIYINLFLHGPAILTAFFMSFIVSFSQYIVNFLIGGGLVNTFSNIIFPILSEKDRHVSSVYSIVFLAISLIVYFLSLYFSKRISRINE